MIFIHYINKLLNAKAILIWGILVIGHIWAGNNFTRLSYQFLPKFRML